MIHSDGSGLEWRSGELDVVRRLFDNLFIAWRCSPASWLASPWELVAVGETREGTKAAAYVSRRSA